MAKVGLVVDNTKRDLDGVLLVAYEILKKGHTPVLIPMYELATDVTELNLDAIVLNYLRPANINLARALKNSGLKVYILDTEGGVLSEDSADSPDKWAKTFFKNKMYEVVDGYFFWGSRLLHAFKSYSGIKDNQIHLTGCPRYDFCAKPWNQFLDYEFKDYILINTNFSSINSNFNQTEEREISSFLSSGWERNYVIELLSETKAAFKKYLDVIEKLAQDLPNEKILIRPHPFENELIYCERLSKYSNVSVSGKGNVLNMISNSKMVLHFNCGSAVETILLNKTPINFYFLGFPFLVKHTHLPSKISLNASSYEDLLSLIQSDKLRTQRFNARDIFKEHIEQWFGPCDGKAASRVAEVIVNNLSQVKKNRIKIPFESTKVEVAKFISSSLGSKLYSKIRASLKPARKTKMLYSKDIESRVNKISKIDNKSHLIKVSHSKKKTIPLPLSSLYLQK